MHQTEHHVDVTHTDAVREFVARSDAIGTPDSKAVESYWSTVRFTIPNWLHARAAQLHPLSREYFELQDQLYIFLRGGPYMDRSSELTTFDKEAALASHLAYPNRAPRDLNVYMRAHAKFAEKFDTDQPCDVLEVGSGWGFSTEYLARLGHRVSAVDINPDFVEVASRRSEKLGLGIDYRLGTFEDLPLKPGETFDVIYCFEAFHHSRDFCGTLKRLTSRLRPHGQFIMFGEPFIPESMWASWGLRMDALSIYCVAKFGWWESGWTREFMEYIFHLAGLCSTFIDEGANLERYMIGRLGSSFNANQLSFCPLDDGWLRDRHYLVSRGNSRIEFHRRLSSISLILESFSPIPLSIRFESQALDGPIGFTIVAGPNRVDVPLSAEMPDGRWELRILAQTWNPLRLTGHGEDRELSFHLVAVEESL